MHEYIEYVVLLHYVCVMCVSCVCVCVCVYVMCVYMLLRAIINVYHDDTRIDSIVIQNSSQMMDVLICEMSYLRTSL